MNSVLSCLMVVMAAGTGQLDTVEESSSDSALSARIETTFLFNEHLSPYDISTTSSNGVVTLSGGVPTHIQKELAGDLAASYESVRSVENRITIEPDVAPSIPKRNFRRKIADRSVSASVRTRLMYRKNLRGLTIKALTINKVVTISGMVDSEFQKEEIEYIAMQTKGVERVINQLAVRGGEIDEDTKDFVFASSDEFVEQRVEESISLNRHLSVRRVNVEVDGGVCYLTGTVQTADESRLAESIAINTGGVREVRNTIRVGSDVEGGDVFLDVLEPLEMPELEPLEAGGAVIPTSGDTPLFSEGARID